MGYIHSPKIAGPRYTSTLDNKDEEFLLSNLQKISLPSTSTRHVHGGPPPLPPYGNYGPPMNYQMGPYGPQMITDYAYGHMPGYPQPTYGGPNYQEPPAQYYPPSRRGTGHSRNDGRMSRGPDNSNARNDGHMSRGPDTSNALVLRRSDDDSDVDPETKTWKDMFVRHFASTHGWAELHCDLIIPGAVEEATSKNSNLWDYILKVAACYKDPQAAPKHALFMLNAPPHRMHFIARLLLQYVQQEMLTWKFWLGWDEETDVKLNSLGPMIEHTGHALDTRRDARQQIRRIVEEIVKDEDYARFKKFKQTQHANRMKDIGGPFVKHSNIKDAFIGLHSLANSAMEISMKMMTSRLTFTFTWNECAVKFSNESHVAMNSDQHGLALQHKHTRVGLVVTPSISYRDDSGRSIVPRGVCKAQVLIMN